MFITVYFRLVDLRPCGESPVSCLQIIIGAPGLQIHATVSGLHVLVKIKTQLLMGAQYEKSFCSRLDTSAIK